MSTLAEKRKEVKDKFKAIKNTINNEKDSFEDRLKAKTDEYKKKVTDFNKKLEDIDSSAEDLQKKYGAKIGEFTSDLKKKLPNPDNIFEKISSDLVLIKYTFANLSCLSASSPMISRELLVAQ